MNGKFWPSLAGLLVGALISGFVSMAMFGRQLARVETQVKANGAALVDVKTEARQHQQWHLDQP